MIKSIYKSITKNCISSYCYGKIFLYFLFNFCLTGIAESTTMNVAAFDENYGFNVPILQDDTVRRPTGSAIPADTTINYILLPGEKPSQKVHKDLFVKVVADKMECYVGEPVLVTYKLYSRLITKSKISKQPALNGFSVYDMIDNVSISESTELVQNRPFKVHVLRKAQIVPLQTGTMQLDPIEVENTVHFVRGSLPLPSNSNNLQDLINQFSTEESSPATDIDVTIKSSPVKIIVKSFPEVNQPNNFNGAVGSFSIRATVTTKNLSVNDAAILFVEIKGRGNVSLIDAPVIRWPAGIDTLDLRIKEQINKAVAPLSGSKTFEFVFTPLKAGRYRILPILFSFFNPARHSYQTVQTQPEDFLVAAGNKMPILKKVADSSLSNEKTNYTINTIATYLRNQSAWIAIVSVLFILIIYLWQKNKRLQKKEDSAGIGDKLGGAKETHEENPVPAGPTDSLSESRRLLESENYKAFYAELNSILWNQLTLRLNISLTELSKNKIIQELRQKGWTEEMTSRLDTVLLKCERSIYLPDYQQETNGEILLESVQKLIADLENV